MYIKRFKKPYWHSSLAIIGNAIYLLFCSNSISAKSRIIRVAKARSRVSFWPSIDLDLWKEEKENGKSNLTNPSLSLSFSFPFTTLTSKGRNVPN